MEGLSRCYSILFSISNIWMGKVGNKKDLEDQREVSYEEGLDFARRNKLIFFETSAKTSENVDNTFTHATKLIYANV